MLAFYPYFRDIHKKITRPHPYTWLILSITQGVGTVSIIFGGGGLGAVYLGIGTIFNLIIFLLSLHHDTKNITRSDVIVLIIALIAIAIWWLLDNPVVAIAVISAIDVLSYIPTFRKTYLKPYQETIQTWLLFAVANIFSLLALDNYNFLTLAYLMSLTSANILLVFWLVWRRQIIPQSSTKTKQL